MEKSQDDLFLAILSMDAYNRKGLNNNISVGLDVTGTAIGNATLALSNGNTSSGFFAQSYDLSGSKVIAFRGTDSSQYLQFLPDGNDVLHGWLLGAGSYSADQAEQAAEFFQDVVGKNATLADLYNANITLTGHSLGGGLAGFLGTIYRQSSVTIFDSMRFSRAAQSLYDNARPTQHFDEYGTPSGIYADDPGARDWFFRGTDPNGLRSGEIANYSVQGQFLSPSTGWFGAPTSVGTPEFDLGFSSNELSGSQRHSQSLLVIRMFADTEVTSNNWLQAGLYVFPALFDERIGAKLGLVAGGPTGSDTAAGKLRTMIAYSAIQDGEMIYGNTGIRTFYDDANDLGKVLGFVNASTTVKNLAANLSTILTQYAGKMAVDKVDFNKATDKKVLSGVLTLEGNEGTTLLIDLTTARWGSASVDATGDTIVGRADLLSTIRVANGISEADFKNELARLWQDPLGAKIDKIVFATTDRDVSATMADRSGSDAATSITLFVGAGNADTIKGSGNPDAIFGGNGNDKISGQKGNDLLIGGDGDDVLVGGADKDTLIGGDGADKLVGGEFDEARPSSWNDGVKDVLMGGRGNDTYYISGYNNAFEYNPDSNHRSKSYFLKKLKDIDIISDNEGSNTIVVKYSASDNSDGSYHTMGYDLKWTWFSMGQMNGVLTWGFSFWRASLLFEKDENGVERTYLFLAAGYPSADLLYAIEDFQNVSFGINLEGFPSIQKGTSGSDSVAGTGGSDVVLAGAGDDIVVAGAGADQVRGDDGNDNLSGDDGDDSLNGGNGNDLLYGGAGADWLEGGSEGDRLDGGDGTDTVSYERSGVGVRVDLLNAQAASGDAAGDTLFGIENLFGSSFDDVLIGDIGVNSLRGDAGSDLLVGGVGADSLDGGEGIDTVSYESSTAAVTVNLRSLSGLGGDAAGDFFLSIENLTGSNFADTFTGSDLDNRLEGGAGNDILAGGVGADQLYGGDGDDTITTDDADTMVSGGSGRDTLIYSGTANRQFAIGSTDFEVFKSGSGNDSIYGTGADDELWLGAGNDLGQGYVGNDIIKGEAGDDILMGFEGNDTLDGGDGADRMFAGDGDDIVITDDADTEVSGGNGRDTLIYAGSSNRQYSLGSNDFEVFKSGAGDDGIYGTGGNDEIWLGGGNDLGQGYAGNDTIKGEDGNDVLMGFEGIDLLDGGRGNDTLIGGSDSDTFVFRSGFGQDVVLDFATEHDALEFHDGIFADRSAAFAAATASGGDTIITIDASTSVLLQNVAFASLRVDDFFIV